MARRTTCVILWRLRGFRKGMLCMNRFCIAIGCEKSLLYLSLSFVGASLRRGIRNEILCTNVFSIVSLVQPLGKSVLCVLHLLTFLTYMIKISHERWILLKSLLSQLELSPPMAMQMRETRGMKIMGTSHFVIFFWYQIKAKKIEKIDVVNVVYMLARDVTCC